MSLPVLEDDRLHVLVFGPGTGELVAVRAPPGAWMLIDGCGIGARKYGQALLQHYGAQPSLVALTHPHLDHAVGVAEVIDDATSGPEATWPKLGLLWPSPYERASLNDLQRYFEGGRVEDALSAITDRWERVPASRWDLDAGTSTALGAASVTVLSPERADRDAAFSACSRGMAYDHNRIATALDVSWRGHHVVLGSDLVTAGWAVAAPRCPTRWSCAKVPHHGSVTALHDTWMRGQPRLVVTPFARSNLPSFNASGGVARMLEQSPQVYLTGLPRAHTRQPATSLTRTRQELEVLGKSELDPVTPGWPDCFVAVSIDALGAAHVTVGPGTVVVQPSPSDEA